MADVTSIISEPLVQAGAMGAVILYCLITDFINRREGRRIEAERIAYEKEREKKAQEREDKCQANMDKLRSEASTQLAHLHAESNAILRTFISIARKHFGVKINTPLAEIETDTILRRTEDEHRPR